MIARRQLAMIAVLACGCAPYEIDDGRRQVMQGWADDVLWPRYQQAIDGAGDLAAAIDALCAAPSADRVADVRDAWHRARAPWKQTEVFAFGPYADEPLRFGPKIDAWPARPEAVQAVLDDSFELDPAVVDGLGSFARGFGALEYLLFDPAIDVVEAFAEPRRCAYASALAVNLGDELGGLYEAWHPDGGDYLGQLVYAGATSVEFDSLSDALGEVVNRMGYTVENIQVDKLGRPLGTVTGGGPQPEVAESRWSGRSLADIDDNLAGIEALFFEPPGLSAYLIDRGHPMDARFGAALADARAALDAIDEPLTGAVVDDADDVSAAIDSLRALQALIQVDVLDALSLTLGFNDADGD